MICSQKNAPIIQLKNVDKSFFDSMIILRFGKAKVIKRKFYGAKKEIIIIINIWDVNIDNLVSFKVT